MDYSLDMDTIRKKHSEIATGKYFKLKEGRNKLRILPPVDGSGKFYFEVTHHHGFTDENDRHRAYPCLFAMKREKCPVCKFAKAMEGRDEDIARETRAVTMFMSNIVDRDSGQMRIWSYNAKMLRGIMNYLLNDDYGPEILDPKNGRDLSIVREGTGFKTRYSDPMISPKTTSIGIEDWEEKVSDLAAEVEFKSYAELVKALRDQYSEHIEEAELTFGGDGNGKTEKKSGAKPNQGAAKISTTTKGPKPKTKTQNSEEDDAFELEEDEDGNE